MNIVSNTGPLIGLAKIDLLDILKNFSAEVLIPPAVHRELLGKIGVESSRIDRALSDFIHVTEVTPLKAMGDQSRKIISEWSLDRFCEGVIEALKIPRRDEAGLLSKMALRLWKRRVSVN